MFPCFTCQDMSGPPKACQQGTSLSCSLILKDTVIFPTYDGVKVVHHRFIIASNRWKCGERWSLSMCCTVLRSDARLHVQGWSTALDNSIPRQVENVNVFQSSYWLVKYCNKARTSLWWIDLLSRTNRDVRGYLFGKFSWTKSHHLVRLSSSVKSLNFQIFHNTTCSSRAICYQNMHEFNALCVLS